MVVNLSRRSSRLNQLAYENKIDNNRTLFHHIWSFLKWKLQLPNLQ